MESELVEAWRRNCVMNLMLFDSLGDAALQGRYAPRTRSVAAQFAHMHSVRVYHLQARGRAFLGGLASYPRGAEPSRGEIRAAHRASTEAVAAFLGDCAARGSVPGWHGPPATFLAYLVAHESHHRGLAMAGLRLSGVKVPDPIQWGLWQGWSKPPGTTASPAPAAGKGKGPRGGKGKGPGRGRGKGPGRGKGRRTRR